MQTSPTRSARPKSLLPTLHAKTHFKAAVEYSLGPELTHRSLRDQRGKVEKTIFEEYQKTMDAHHRKVGSHTPASIMGGTFVIMPESQATRRTSVALSNRLNIKRNQEQGSAEYTKLASASLSQAKSKTPAPAARLPVPRASKESAGVTLDAVDKMIGRGSPKQRQRQVAPQKGPAPPTADSGDDGREVLDTQAKKMRDANFNARQVTRQVLKQCNVVREKAFDT